MRSVWEPDRRAYTEPLRHGSITGTCMTIRPGDCDPVPEESGAARKKASTMKGMIMSHVEDPTGPAAVRDPGNQSIAELIKQVSEESTRLLRSELT